MKNKKPLGPLLAILFSIVILFVGYLIGRYIADEYNKKHQTKKNIFEIILQTNESKDINYILDNESTLIKLCKKDTGICNEEVGVIKIDNTEVKLHIYTEFDNPEGKPATYFKLNNKKIGSFVYLDKFLLLDNKYLIITEPNSYNVNYNIHIYNKEGIEVASYEATDSSLLEIKNNELHFKYCSSNDSIIENEELLPRVSNYKISPKEISKKEEVSYEYKKCS